MTTHFHQIIAKELQLADEQVARTIQLLEEGATIPFISRYRKERTGGLDEIQIGAIQERLEQLKELEKRKETILRVIGEQDKLTPELERRVRDSWNATEIEDLYLPFRPKRQTRAEIARKRGLEPLAKMIMAQNNPDVESKARNFLGDEVKTAADAIQGAKDIIAEWVNEDERARDLTRAAFSHTGMITSKVVKGKEEEGQKYKDYFDFQEPRSRCAVSARTACWRFAGARPRVS